MRPGIVMAMVAALLSSAAAEARIDVDTATGLVSCTTTPGNFSQRAIVSRAEGGHLAGRIRLVTPAGSERWVPAAGFLFNGSNDRSAGIQIALSPDDPSSMLVGMRLPGQRQLIEMGALPANIWIPLTVSLDSDGMMTVTVGPNVQRRRVRLNGTLEPVIHCNSGTFAFRLDAGMRLADPPAGED